ncbi:cysteine--tRNA ligase [Candidatus Falkowbacteria bacterium]|nr:cysteine--tRNA ligase [Candidatus Falkowbacteria bacterium]MBT6573668.1 cysteine--tRNA ligase [Candidatus Falkowbacteria bacterium]MBT7500139.1 cysteine--tRNA ligase [Candidatus Falkowbacteria bacterium]
MKLYNTMSRKIEEFKPISEKEVTMYNCGPTVYDYAHVGNLRSYIFADILKRSLLYNDFNVKQVINITDVGHLTGDSDEGEDKIEKSARLESKSASEVAEFYTNAFKQDLIKLNILSPEIWAKATDHIQEMIDLVKMLEKNGFTYKISDGIYFDTSKSKEYGKLAKLNLEGQEEGARVEVNSEKRNPTDFALWKFSPKEQKRQMEWDSPWGVGFPGWHLECSAMSMKYLGETLDIHTGGIDATPVHHTNEIAQSEAATGKTFVNYWLHSEFLLINDGRMGKSKGNFITLQTIENKGFDPIVYRFFCLSSHYRSKLNFSWEALANARNGWDKFKKKFMDLGKVDGQVDQVVFDRFKEYIDNDLSIPQALAVAWDVLKSDSSDADKRATLLAFDKVFGLNLENLHKEEVNIPAEVQVLIDKRLQARRDKKWDKADDLRKEIEDLGWLIEDAADSTVIKKK